MYQTIGVYLSSKSGLRPAYAEAAEQVGALIGRTGRTLVYGGARKGLMEVLAQSVKKNGGRVYGMVPEVIVERGMVSEAIDVEFRCADLSDRKAAMNRESDVLVALPGGIGTLDEAFTVMANTCIGIERKPLVFYNVEGCWEGLLAALDHLFAQKLISGTPEDYYRVATSLAELEAML